MTRLRSDAGSFVRSPAGAFDGEGEAGPCDDWVAQMIVEDDLAEGFFWASDPAECATVGFQNLGLPGVSRRLRLIVGNTKGYSKTLSRGFTYRQGIYEFSLASFLDAAIRSECVTPQFVSPAPSFIQNKGNVTESAGGPELVYEYNLIQQIEGIPNTEYNFYVVIGRPGFNNSFYQGALLNFVTGPVDVVSCPISPGGGTMGVAIESTLGSRVVRANCALGDYIGGTPGFKMQRFDYDNLSIPVESFDIVHYYHIGLTSGAVWRPADNGMEFHCRTAGFSAQTDTDFNPGGTPINVGGVLDIYPYHGEIFIWDKSVVPFERGAIQTDAYVNDGEFPSAGIPAFIDGEAFILSLTPPVTIASGTVTTVPADPSASWGLYSGCIQQPVSTGNLGILYTQFDYSSGSPLPSELINGLHVGRNSGASWRPSDDLVAFSCAVDTPGQPNYRETWVGPNSIARGSAIVYEVNLMLFRDPVVQLQYYVNNGEFPAATQPGFIAGEPFDVYAPP